MRRFGQQIIEWLGGKRIHPGLGGAGRRRRAARPPRPATRSSPTIPEALAAIQRALDWYKAPSTAGRTRRRGSATFPSAFMGLVDPNGKSTHYDGRLRVMDADGQLLADGIDPRPYADYLGEAVEPWSYLKSTYWKALGYPDGVYRVGPLARVIVADQMGTPHAPTRSSTRSGDSSGPVPDAARSTTTTPG